MEVDVSSQVSEGTAAGIAALDALTSCKGDVEKGGVLPPLVAVMADATPNTNPTNFIGATLQSYPYSIFLEKESCAVNKSPSSPSSIEATIQSLLSSPPSPPNPSCALSSLLCAVLKAVDTVQLSSTYPSSPKPTLALPPLWLAYCDYDSTSTHDSLSSKYESLTAISSLIKSFRLSLLSNIKTSSPELGQKLFGAYIHTINRFLLPVESDTPDPYSFSEYFSSSKSRLYTLGKELGEEKETLFPSEFKDNDSFKTILSSIESAVNSPSVESPLSAFHSVLQKTSEVLQAKLAESNLSAPLSPSGIPEDSAVLSGGFQSGYGDVTFLPILNMAVADRKAVERKLPNSKTKSWIPLYERFLSELPTVPEIWLDYVKNLIEAAFSNAPTAPSPNLAEEKFFYDLAKDVVQRGIKNIPWCLDLHKLRVSLVASPVPCEGLGDEWEGVLQKVEKLVNRSCKSGFLTYSQKVAAWLAGCKEHRLMLIDAIVKKRNGANKADGVSEDDEDEDEEEDDDDLVDDLASELREFYSKAEDWAKKNKPNKKVREGKIIKSRAFAESFVICEDEGLPKKPPSSDASKSKAVECWEKLVSADRFSYTTWNDYTSYVLNRDKVYGLQEISQLLRRAFTAMCGKEGIKGVDVDGCRRIGKRYVDFEEEFNSLVWALRARTLVEGKMKKLGDVDGVKESSQDLAPVEAVPVDAPPEKKRKREDGEAAAVAAASTSDEPKEEGGKEKKKSKHFVMVGNLKWPAHPTTVHILNLHLEASEADVVEAFKKCGELVKVRVLREKEFVNNKKVFTKSKGRALVQFLAEEGVEAALEFDDAIGIKGQVIKVERSRLAAVEPVAGRPNEKKKKKKEKNKGAGAGGGEEGAQKKKKPSSLFKPRNVMKKVVKKTQLAHPPQLGTGEGNDGAPKGNAVFADMFK